MQHNPDFIIIPFLLVQDSSITPLDCQVYGIIYWAARLKNEKCTMTNQTIADLLQAKMGSVANAVSRLHKKGYIKVLLNEDKQREEILPLIFYTQNKDEGSSNNEGGVHQIMKGGSLSNESPIDIYNKNINNINTRKSSFSKELIEQTSELCRKKSAKDQCGKCAYCTLALMDQQQLYDVAVEEKINMSAVKQTYESILNQIKGGEFKHKTIYHTLKNWINLGKGRGTIREIGGFELDVMKMQYDMKYIDELKDLEALAIKKGLL